MIPDEYIEHTSNGVPYEWQLCNDDGASFTILIDLDDKDNIPTEQQILEAKNELLLTQDVVRLSVVTHKKGDYKMVESRKVNKPIASKIR